MRLFGLCVAFALIMSLALPGCGGKATMEMDKDTVGPGGIITVTWTAPGSFNKNAWIGIIPSKIAHGSEATNDQHDLTYQYLQGKTKGTFLFTVPKQKGSYDFRMHDTDSNGKEVASLTFKVK